MIGWRRKKEGEEALVVDRRLKEEESERDANARQMGVGEWHSHQWKEQNIENRPGMMERGERKRR